MRRIHSADIIKSVMIIVVIIIHRIFYDWSGYQGPVEESDGVLLMIFGFFGAMGSIFAYITGLVTSFAVYNRLKQKRNSPKQIILASVATLFLLLVINYVIIFFFAGGIYINDQFHYGVITNGLRTGEWVVPGLEIISLYAGVLMIIGISGFITTLVAVLLNKGRGIEKVNRNKKTFIALGLLVLIVSPILSPILEPMGFEVFNNSNYILAGVLTNLAALDFPVLPILGFALIAAALGTCLASGTEYKRIIKNWRRKAWILVVIGLVLGVLFLIQGTLVFDFARYVHLGIYILVTIALLKRFEFKSNEHTNKYPNLNRFGKVTLTIFILETPLAAVLHLIPNIISDSWDTKLPLVLIFALINVWFWHLVIKYWEKVGYRWSFEWMIAKTIKLISGKSSDKIKNPPTSPIK
jgi:hypothetical protein